MRRQLRHSDPGNPSPIQDCDLELLAGVVELDSHMMHGIMTTSTPPLYYWMPVSLDLMQAVRAWRRQGISVRYTLEAGSNVHVITTRDAASKVVGRLGAVPGVKDVLIERAEFAAAFTLPVRSPYKLQSHS